PPASTPTTDLAGEADRRYSSPPQSTGRPQFFWATKFTWRRGSAMERGIKQGASRAAIVAAILLALSAASGCNVLATMMYVVQGHNVRAEFNEMRGKRVVVVCRPSTAVEYNHTSVAKELAAQLSKLLQTKVEHVRVVKQREVDEWVD